MNSSRLLPDIDRQRSQIVGVVLRAGFVQVKRGNMGKGVLGTGHDRAFVTPLLHRLPSLHARVPCWQARWRFCHTIGLAQ